MIFDTPIRIGELDIPNRLVMPPMQTNKTDRGHVTAELVQYYRDRAVYSRPGIIITEHSCIAESGRAAEGQLSIAADEYIEEHRQLTDAIHAGGSKAFVQLNHAGSNGIGEVDLIDLSGGMCFFFRPGHLEAGYFSSMSEKVKARVSVPVLLTGGVQHAADAEKLLNAGKADLIGVGRALLKDAHWRETA